MAYKTSYPPRKSDIFLGETLKKLRVKLKMSLMQVGGKVNETSQQIDRYESGAFIPLPKLEDLADSMGVRIPKKLIRQISIERKIQAETGVDRSAELIELYNLSLPLEEIFADL